MKELADLFMVFARMGAFTFGGGYAMLPIIQKEIVEKRGWATNEEVMDYYAIGQVTPGIIAVNTATFIGYKLKGVIGGIVATAGMVLPSIIIISIIAMFFEQFASYPLVQHAFAGVRIVVVALIIQTTYDMAKKAIVDKVTGALFGIGLLLMIVLPISVVWFVVAGALIGMAAGRKKEVK
ncbi:MAG: chromate transporter [Cellulosilyticaceae bacterium]